MTILDGWTDKIGLHGEEFQTGIFQMRWIPEKSVQSVQNLVQLRWMTSVDSTKYCLKVQQHKDQSYETVQIGDSRQAG